MVFACLVIGFGLCLDMVNIYWDIKSAYAKTPSGIILTPLIFYAIGSLLLGSADVSWIRISLSFGGLLLLHVLSVLLLPYFLMILMNMTHGRKMLDFRARNKKYKR